MQLPTLAALLCSPSSPLHLPLPIFFEGVGLGPGQSPSNMLRCFPPPFPVTSPLCSHAPPSEPCVYRAPLNSSVMGTSISIDEYLQERLIKELFDGALTDYEYSDSEGSISVAGHVQPMPQQLAPSIPHTALPTEGVTYTRAQMENRRKAMMRRAKRAAASSDSGLKQVVKKRRSEGTKDSLEVPYSMYSDAAVTKPGWVGRGIARMPKQVQTKGGLVSSSGMVCFPWDGR
jgi:hypothetical protein